MQAVVINQWGGPDVLTLQNIAKPIPSANQLLVGVHATALNRADLLQRRGKYPPPTGESPILGLEIAGEVVALGKNVTHHQLGDRVFGLVSGGGYAEFCVIDSKMAMPIPRELSYLEAAAIPEAFLTAYAALFSLAQLKPHETVLIHAGGSGVGSAAIQLAKHHGATVYTTLRSGSKASRVKTLGADHSISTLEQPWSSALSAGIDVILDVIGAPYLADHVRILNTDGRLIIVGLMGGSQTNIDLNVLLAKRLQLKGLKMRTLALAQKRRLTQQFQKTWLHAFSKKTLYPVIDSVFALHDVQAAHRKMESNANCGKIILQIC